MNIFTQAQSASQRGMAITGDSCLRGGNHAGARRRSEETAEPADQVDIGKQVGDVAKLAGELANQTGSEVTLEMGGVKVTVKPGKNSAPKSIAQIDEPASEPEVRPEVKKFLDELKEGTITGTRHTTRAVAKTKAFVPEAPQPFRAGRFAVDFTTADGEKRGFIVQTESKVGHLGAVTPGATNVGGHVSILGDPSNDRDEKITLTRDEQDAMLASLYGKTGQQMTAEQAQNTNGTISWVASVRYSGEGAHAVQDMHKSYV